MQNRAIDHEVDSAETEAVRLWVEMMERHRQDGVPGVHQVEALAGVLGDSLSEDDEILAALVTLAQAPLSLAGRVLSTYAAAPHPGFGHLATLAWDEWRFWAHPLPLDQVA